MKSHLTAQQAFAIFKEINTKTVVKASTVYWEALGAERDGVITIGEMDAISVFHKAEIVQLWEDDQAYIEYEAKAMAEVHEAQGDYWRDLEAGVFDQPERMTDGSYT